MQTEWANTPTSGLHYLLTVLRAMLKITHPQPPLVPTPTHTHTLVDTGRSCTATPAAPAMIARSKRLHTHPSPQTPRMRTHQQQSPHGEDAGRTDDKAAGQQG
jgi:hypothetical protein